MGATYKFTSEDAKHTPGWQSSDGRARTMAISLGAAVIIAVVLGYMLFSRYLGPPTQQVSVPSSTDRTDSASPGSSSQPSRPEVLLTRASIDLLLDELDQAVRRKDVEGVLRHIAPDAVIVIHMKQGSHQQTAGLTREDYRKTLAMEFAFPSANDFTRVNTSVSLAADERSAKVSFKSTETLLQANREVKVDGEETLVVRMRNEKPVIVSLDKVVPGDSN
jgi:ketosteroid isomerase-like protein